MKTKKKNVKKIKLTNQKKLLCCRFAKILISVISYALGEILKKNVAFIIYDVVVVVVFAASIRN